MHVTGNEWRAYRYRTLILIALTRSATIIAGNHAFMRQASGYDAL
jgi:hypothetical protein